MPCTMDVFVIYLEAYSSSSCSVFQCVNVVFTKLLDGGYSLEAMKLCLFCEQDEFYEKVVEQLRYFKEVGEMNRYKDTHLQQLLYN